MTVQEVAKSVMKVTGTTQRKLAEEAGLSGQGAVSMYLRSKSMRVEALLMMLNTCGYELVARDKHGRLPEFVIGDDNKACAGSDTEAARVKEESEEDKLRAMIRKMIAEEMGK